MGYPEMLLLNNSLPTEDTSTMNIMPSNSTHT